MPNYTAREGLTMVIEKDEKPKKKKEPKGGSLPPDDYSAENPRESDEVYQEMKSTGKTFAQIHKEMEQEKNIEDAEGGGFKNLVNSIKSISPKQLNLLKTLSQKIWSMNKEGFTKGVLVDVVKAKDSNHLGKMMEKDKEICNNMGKRYVDGMFHKTLKKVVDIASNL